MRLNKPFTMAFLRRAIRFKTDILRSLTKVAGLPRVILQKRTRTLTLTSPKKQLKSMMSFTVVLKTMPIHRIQYFRTGTSTRHSLLT